MKQIYWIDDDFIQMFYIIKSAISKLWALEEDMEVDEKIRSNIIIFGNGCQNDLKEKSFTLQEEEKANSEVVFWYIECCRGIDGPDLERPVYHKNKTLIKNSVRFLLKEDEEDEKKIYEEIKRMWTDTVDNEAEGGDKKKREQAEELIKRMEIDKGAVIGIDMALMHGDIERIEESKTVISMELYYLLRKRGLKCFLYSSEAGEFSFTEKWKNTYKERYFNSETTAEKMSNFQIYERSDFFDKSKRNVVSELKDLLMNKM